MFRKYSSSSQSGNVIVLFYLFLRVTHFLKRKMALLQMHWRKENTVAFSSVMTKFHLEFSKNKLDVTEKIRRNF